MHKLDNQEILNKIDSKDLYHTIIHMPENVLKSYSMAKIINADKIAGNEKISKVVIFAAESTEAVEICRNAFSQFITIEVAITGSKQLITNSTLCIFADVSGKEVDMWFAKTAEKTNQIAIISTRNGSNDGIRQKYVWLDVEEEYSNYSAVAQIFFSCLKILEAYHLLPTQAAIAKSVTAHLITKAGAIAMAVPREMNFAKASAEIINNKIPIIIAVENKFQPLANRWNSTITHYAGYPAFCSSIEKMKRSFRTTLEVKGLEKEFIPIILDTMQCNENDRIRKNEFVKLLNELNIEFLEFYMEGKTYIEQIFSLLYLGDMISLYLAVLRDHDPSSV